MITLNNIVRSHQFRERLDILLSVWVPLFLMLESGWGNTWAFAGGHMSVMDLNTWIALARGFFLEGLLFAMFRLTRAFVEKGGWSWVFVPVSFAIGLFSMLVSAGCNVGYIVHGGEMDFVVSVVAQYMGSLASVFKVLLGWLFPLGVAAYALIDIGRLIDEHVLHSRHLDERSMIAQEAESWRRSMLEQGKKASNKYQKELAVICDTRAAGFVTAARNGDFSFGAKALDQTVPPPVMPATGRIQTTGAPASQLAFPSRPAQPGQLPPPRTLPAQPPINGQVSLPPVASTGNTQPIVMPPLPIK
jgi:hypothetical protein